MNTTSKTMYEALPVVSELNKVPGFDPRKFMRKTVSEPAKQEVLYLDLKFKKLWFRLAYPAGRIKVTALKITEQIAIIEAKVFFSKGDTEPVSSFIAQRNAKGKPGSLYIESAQHAAVSQALTDAGFGLQFCDVSQGPDSEMLDEGIPLPSTAADAPASALKENIPPAAEYSEEIPPANDTPPAEETPPADAVLTTEEIPPAEETPSADAIPLAEEAPPADEIPPAEETQPAEQAYAPAAEPAPVTSEARQQDEIPAQADIPVQTDVPDQAAMPAQAEASVSDNAGQPPVQAVFEITQTGQPEDIAPQDSHYTADMTVDEILGLMTPDEAEAVVVDIGTCKGWTLAEVMERRPASLKWYLNGYTGDNNILKAGAKLLLERGFERKAG